MDLSEIVKQAKVACIAEEENVGNVYRVREEYR